jgi:hypothetical protein
MTDLTQGLIRFSWGGRGVHWSLIPDEIGLLAHLESTFHFPIRQVLSAHLRAPSVRD